MSNAAFYFFILINLLFIQLLGKEYAYKLSIAAITKDEDLYLTEWISYHKLMGVDHFYIYDNNAHNQTKIALKPYIDEGIVELIPWPNLWPNLRFFDGCQIYAYQNALQKAKHQTKWLAIIDTDEFIVPMQDDHIVDVLEKHYKQCGFIYVNWRMFGTSYEFVKPGESLLPKLIKCAKQSDRLGKTICRPEFALTIYNVHFVENPFPYFNGSGEMKLDEKICDQLIRINHYFMRDENFLRNVKIPRLKKMWGLKETEEELLQNYQLLNEKFCEEEDFRILELLQLAESKIQSDAF